MTMERIKKRWESFSAREKQLVIVGASLIVLTFYGLALFRPLLHAVEKRQNQNETLIADWHWMQQKLPETQSMQASNRSAPVNRPVDTSLMNWLDSQLSQAQLQVYVKRLEPVDSNQVTLWLEKVPMTALLRWLDQLQKGNGVLITEFDAVPVASEPGLGTVRLTLYAP